MIGRSFLAASLLAASCGTALAADDVLGVFDPALPWYGEVRLGAPVFQDFDFIFLPAGPVGVYDPVESFFIEGAVGKYLTERIRADISLTFASVRDGVVILPGPVLVPHTGTLNAITVLGNVYYEFPDTMPALTPWVGVGAGATFFDYNGLGGPGFQYNDSDVAFTVAAHLGADYAVTENLDITARYSLQWTGDHSVSATTAGPVPISADSFISNIFTIGLRLKFGGD